MTKKQLALEVIRRLKEAYPDAGCTLDYDEAWKLLVSVRLAAQCTDARVNVIVEKLYEKFPDVDALAAAGVSEIEEIVAKNPDSVVIVDEAYVDFGGVSALPLVDKYENLLVVQTFSKSRALAGMRIGFAIGQKKLISYLNDVKFSFNSYTMNRLTIACGKACVEDRAYFQEITGKIVATREWTKQKLTELGFTFPDSKANFIFATHKTVPAQELFENLKTAGIYVRYFKKPRIDNYLRITVGTQAEMERLVEVLVELVK